MTEQMEAPPAEGGGGKRRRRRRRRRKGGDGNYTPPQDGGTLDAVLVVERDETGKKTRRQAVDFANAQVSLPATGRNPHRKRGTRARRGVPVSLGGRVRSLSRVEMDDLIAWLNRMPQNLLANLYKGLGGQPGRISDDERITHLTARAIAQQSRIGNLLRSLHERDRKALAAMLQCGGIGHGKEFVRELQLSYGGHEREWTRTLNVLAEKGVVMATAEQDGQFFFVIPEVLIDPLLVELAADLTLPTLSHPEVRVIDEVPFCPPLDFTITSLATFVDHTSPRLTQRQEIYRHDQESMDAFFAQLWSPNSELFTFHLDFLLMHGMVQLRGEYLALDADVMEEWLQLEAEDQRDLLFRALDKRFPMAEWVLWSVHAATTGPNDWVAERPLVDLYRRWKRGEEWRSRLKRGVVHNARTLERESYSFAPLVRAGILDMGTWGQEKLYRLSPRGKVLLEPPEDDGFRQFYLTPSFEIMAPAGLAPILLFRIGELAELTGCDRANTYKITETSIEKALKRGWRRDDIVQFLRDNSQIGLPENVEKTLKGWIGNRGDIEFHELCMMTVHKSQIRRLEAHKRVKPYLLHRFAPGMYAVDKRKRAELTGVLVECGFSPAKETVAYPGAPQQVEAREALHKYVAEARESGLDPSRIGQEVVPPEDLRPVPGTKVADKTEREEQNSLPPEVAPGEVRGILDRAMGADRAVEMVYVAKTGQKLTLSIRPERFAFKADSPVLVGIDQSDGERRTFLLERIERLRIVE